MALIVQKYGGSSVATPEAIKHVAKRVANLKNAGHQVIIVISAMGSTTDQLSDLAYQVSKIPVRRELDMLLSTGERVASSLMSLALNALGCEAISFTGSQAGVLTDDSHTNARVVDIKPFRIQEELSRGKIVVIAGFQGVSPVTKEITTLGRGGTDLSAIAMAYYFKAERCEILKQVDGVFSADPHIVKKAKRIPEISFDVLQEITFWGAKMLHHRAAELAARIKIPLHIGFAHKNGKGTKIVDKDSSMFEEKKILSVNSHSKVFKLEIKSSSHGDGYDRLEKFLKTHNLPWPQILDSTYSGFGCVLLISAPNETLEALLNLSKKARDIEVIEDSLSSVTATCAGIIASSLVGELTQKIESKKIKAHHVLISPMSATFIVNAKDRESAIRTLHG